MGLVLQFFKCHIPPLRHMSKLPQRPPEAVPDPRQSSPKFSENIPLQIMSTQGGNRLLPHPVHRRKLDYAEPRRRYTWTCTPRRLLAFILLACPISTQMLLPKLVGLLNKIGDLLIVQAGSALHHSLLLIHDPISALACMQSLGAYLYASPSVHDTKFAGKSQPNSCVPGHRRQYIPFSHVTARPQYQKFRLYHNSAIGHSVFSLAVYGPSGIF